MAENKNDNPDVVAPPPAIYLGALLGGLLVNYIFPLSIFFVPRRIGLIVGLILIVAAAAVIALAFRAFARAKTNVEPWKPTNAIVDTSVYGFSRNPIYVAMTLLYVGASLLLDSLWSLLFVLPVLFLINFGVIAREERYLEKKFGAEYLNYKKRVRRWI